MKAKVTLVKIWAVTACALTLGTIFFLFAYIFYHGAGAITWEFLTESPKGTVLGTKGGILPAIVGSAWYTGIASLFGAALGICTAIYQVYYCRSRKVADGIALVMKCMAGVPSIVMGLFGYTLLVLTLGWGKCVLAGGITQGVMILPFIQVRAEKALREVDPALVAASGAQAVAPLQAFDPVAVPSLVDLRTLRDLRAFADDWLAPALSGLSEGRLKSLLLDLEDGTGYRLSRGQRWRFWRRPRDTLAQ